MPTPFHERDRVAWSVRDWCHAVSISPAYLYELIQAGKVRSARVGGKRLILTRPTEFLAQHEEAA